MSEVGEEVDKHEWLKDLLKPLRSSYREVFLMSLFINLLALAVPIFTMQTYDRVINSEGLVTLQGFVIGMICVIAFDLILKQTRSRLMQRTALRIDVSLGNKLFNKILSVPLPVLENRVTSFWTALFRDVEVVRNTRSGPSAVLITDLPFAIFFLVLVSIVATPIMWVPLIILPTFLVLGWRSAATLTAANAAERKTGYDRDAMVAEMIAGRTTVKALALEESIRPLWEDKHAATIEDSMHRGRKSDTFGNYGASLTTITTVAMTSAGAIAIINQDMTMGSLIAANMLMGRILGPFNQLVGSWRNYASYRQAVNRLSEIFVVRDDRQEVEVELGRPEGQITLENVTFGYSEEAQPTINDVKLQIRPNSFIAVMGPNGSGKTTLIKLILGLYKPQKGRVLLDGADMSQFTRRELAKWFGYVPQEIFLFNGSIRENIAKANPEASDDDVIRAAKMAGVHPFLIDLPDGYSTDIGEAGRLLPGGLRQRLAIARAFLADPPILIMDEPSSNLDREGEAELVRLLQTLARDHTVLVITHSQNLLQSAGQILVMQKGKIVKAGPPKEVLADLVRKPQAEKPATGRTAPAPRRPREAGGPRREPAAAPPPAENAAPAEREPIPPKRAAPSRRPPPPSPAPADDVDLEIIGEEPPAAAPPPADEPKAAPRPAVARKPATVRKPAPAAPPAPAAETSNVRELRPNANRVRKVTTAGKRQDQEVPAAAKPSQAKPAQAKPVQAKPVQAKPAPAAQKSQRPAAAPAKPAAPLDAAARRRLAQRKQAERNRA
ncbi:MAG: ATP-binding cassette domain-containing protein [Alphaproteobacteria bacterium]